ncbi:MAG: DUF58 domain-containing protein [Candidatus Eremiobacteraeota bacterium]|nr:DUF58 domain-containing protein [Candidatus Eremiobacteraeota bacterium]
MKETELLTPEFLKKLKLLQIMSKKVAWGTQKGEHTSSQKGRSLEFSDFRNYVRGDDIRYIDWNIYGRLEKLFLKLFVEELDLIVYLLIDTSASMSLGGEEKLHYAKKIAACISFIALSHFDRVSIAAMDEGISLYQPPLRGTNQIFQCFRFLSGLRPRGKTSLGASLLSFGRKKLRPGLVVVLSDFLQEGEFFEGLSFLLYEKYSLFLIQVLDPLEKNPVIEGDLKLVDIETESAREVTVSERLLAAYRRNFQRHTEKIEQYCARHGAGFLQTTTDTPFEEIVLKYLRMGRLLA